METSRERYGKIWFVGAACAALLLLAACGGESAPRAVRAERTRLDACQGTAAHDAHAAVNIGCVVCHPCGGKLEFTPFTFAGGTSTAGGVIVRGDGTTPTTCTVACHAVDGTTPQPVTWATGPLDCTACHAVASLPPTHPRLVEPAPTRADCLECHDQTTHTAGTVRVVGHGALWMDPADQGFHAYAANLGLANCQACHAADLTGGITGVSCAQCHDANLPQGVASWKVNCLMCHGGTDNTTGAPPRATWGHGAEAVRVGAHSTHVAGSALAPAFDCVLCHVKPVDALAAGHVDGPFADVRFEGIAASRTPVPASWDRTGATCSNTYCHGDASGGGSNNTPIWTSVGTGEAACGACHGLPPPPPHLAVAADFALCAVCHSDTLDPGGQMIPPSAGGLHLDGVVEASGHEASWMDTADPDFHAYSVIRGLSACKACHGEDLGGGSVQVGCAQCHGATWRTNCTMCHGGTFDLTGAPPRTIWGQQDDPVRVGAHQRHGPGSTLSAGFDCDACHVTPADALAEGHIDLGTATVLFGDLAVQGGALPTWTRPTATCSSTYCHGNYSGVYTYWAWEEEASVAYQGSNATPVWTDGPMTCTSCHGNPPNTGTWHGYHRTGGNDCQLCHNNALGVNGVGTAITNRATHVNGLVEVTPLWRTSCFKCH